MNDPTGGVCAADAAVNPHTGGVLGEGEKTTPLSFPWLTFCTFGPLVVPNGFEQKMLYRRLVSHEYGAEHRVQPLCDVKRSRSHALLAFVSHLYPKSDSRHFSLSSLERLCVLQHQTRIHTNGPDRTVTRESTGDPFAADFIAYTLLTRTHASNLTLGTHMRRASYREVQHMPTSHPVQSTLAHRMGKTPNSPSRERVGWDKERNKRRERESCNYRSV